MVAFGCFQHCCPGPVAEKAAGIPVGPVHNPGQDLGTDDKRLPDRSRPNEFFGN